MSVSFRECTIRAQHLTPNFHGIRSKSKPSPAHAQGQTIGRLSIDSTKSGQKKGMQQKHESKGWWVMFFFPWGWGGHHQEFPQDHLITSWIFERSLRFLKSLEQLKTPSYFPLNPGWLIGILTMVYYNPYIFGECFHPLYTLNTPKQLHSRKLTARPWK